MAKPNVGKNFPNAVLQDIDGSSVEFPAVFAQAPATDPAPLPSRKPLLPLRAAKSRRAIIREKLSLSCTVIDKIPIFPPFSKGEFLIHG